MVSKAVCFIRVRHILIEEAINLHGTIPKGAEGAPTSALGTRIEHKVPQHKKPKRVEETISPNA
jgi:hypothetical protein